MIGIFDSGIGGLSVYLELKKLLPNAGICYLADSANFPYGEKSQEELEKFTRAATMKLVDFGCKVIVVACNSATVSVIDKLRTDFPRLKFVGVEPAVKLAEKITQNKKIGLLATKKTVISHRGENLVDDVTIYRNHDAHLISKIETDLVAVTEDDLKSAIEPLLTEGVDTVVLGCTHFYFVKDRFKAMYPEVAFVEPALYVAEQARLVVGDTIEIGKDIFLVSGDEGQFREFVINAIGEVDVDIRKV